MADPDLQTSETRPSHGTAAEVFTAFLKMGCVSFGGPVAHLGYFNDAFVVRRKWMSAAVYAEIVALCQFLPGPASSQVGMAIGLARAGLPGAFAAWLGFTLPSAILMIAFAYGVHVMGGLAAAPWLHGLKVAAVAVVAQAIVTMARTLCPDLPRLIFAVGAAALAISVPTATGQIGAIALSGALGWWILKDTPERGELHLPMDVPKPVSVAALSLFFLLLAALPFAAGIGGLLADLFDAFYRTGALVFGGGHVVLPLLQREVVPTGWIDTETFLAGYGAAQALPGPLFTFAGFLGAAIAGGWGALVCLIAIFVPSFLLVVGAAPFWNGLRRHAAARRALMGVNAAVVGLLAAAFYDPILPSGIAGDEDMVVAVLLFILLVYTRAPSWLIVLLGAVISVSGAYF